MSGQSPSVVLYNSAGIELDVQPNVTIPTGTSAILVDGTDNGGVARTLLTDTSGRMIVNQGIPNTIAEAWPVVLADGYGNLFGEPANPIYVSGTIMVTNPSVGVPGTTPPTDATYIGALVNTSAPSSYTNGDMYPFSLTTSGLLRIDGVYPVNATTPTTDAVFVAGAVTTSAPTYTTGQMSALSLTTSGLLRVDGTSGIFNNQSIGTDGSAALGFDTQVGGKVTTAAPTYVTGNLDALSLTTVGGLRIDGVYPTGTATASAPNALEMGAISVSTPPTYTAGQLNALTTDVGGSLRVVTNKATTASVTSVSVSATTATSLLASNTARVFASIFNNGTKGTMYVLLGSGTASATNFSITLLPASYWEVPVDWTGVVSCFSTNASTVLLTELTP